jgi:pSer/pThr/pTyr-binding forkhead associated (FHA) protein
MKVTLVFSKGKLAGQTIPIADKQYVIGRHRSCDMCVKSNQISVHHCAVLIQDKKAIVRDFDSTNGTFVNETRIQGDHELRHGDLLRVATVVLQVRLEVDAPGPNPALKSGSISDSAAAALIDGSSHDLDKGILGISSGSVYELTDLQDLPEEKPTMKVIMPSKKKSK